MKSPTTPNPALFFLLLFSAFTASTGYSLTVITQGDGYVSSRPSGILCGAACMETYDAGTSITLTATAQDGDFQAWTGACSGSQATCTLTLDGPKIVTATFAGEVRTTYALTVKKNGHGKGTVSSEPFGITLGQIAPYDTANFQAGSTVTLTAAAQPGSRFEGWSGACFDTQTSCTVRMDAAKSVTATFLPAYSPTPSPAPTATQTPTVTSMPIPSPSATAAASTQATARPTSTPEYELTLSKSGAGRGAIYVWPSGKSQELCGSSDAACTLRYPAGTVLSFQVIPRPDSQFEAWSGDCSGGACEVTLDKPRKITARFSPAPTEAPRIPDDKPGKDDKPTPPYIPRPTPTTAPEKQYSLNVKVTGQGTVKVGDGRLICSGNCEALYPPSSEVPLMASPEPGWKFVGWGGSCVKAEGPQCTVTVEGSSLFASITTVRAVFEPGRTQLSVGLQGDGSVSSSDGRIFCASFGRVVYNCASPYAFESTVELTARASGVSTFERWEGACTHSLPQCAIRMDGEKTARAVFKGPPGPKKLQLSMPNAIGGAIYVMTSEPGVRIPLKECESNCSYEFKHGDKIEVEVKTYGGFVFEGYSGSCIGQGVCRLTMDADRAVAVSFYKATYKKLTIMQPDQGIVIASGSDAFHCGPDGGKCSGDIDTRKPPILQFEGVQGDYGLFESGCAAVVKAIDRWDRTYEKCVLDMSQDRTVRTRLSPEQEKWIVANAMDQNFDRKDYPGLLEFATREDGAPFQYFLAALRSGRVGKNLDKARQWIRDNWDSVLKDTGIGQFMKDYDVRIVRQTLLKTFGPDLEAYKAMKWFRYDAAYAYIVQDTSQKPFVRGMRDWQYYHRKSVAEFEAYLQNQKESYRRNEGIAPFFTEPPQPPKPPAAPILEQIRADDDQIGKPVTLIGSGFMNVNGVLIDGQSFPMRAIDDGRIYLPDVRWGISPDFGVSSNLVFEKAGNTYSSTIQASQVHETTKNADGKVEACFGSVGPGCKGSKGKDFSGTGETNTGKRIGCLAEQDGQRVCYTSAGSIRHDNCCVWNPGGKWCGGTGTNGEPAEEFNHNGKCADEWHEAFWDSFWERTWTETHPMSVTPDLSPYPSPYKRYFSLESKASVRICAPAGIELRESKDAPFCCSGRLDSAKKCT